MKKPEIDAQAVVATGAVVLGDVTIKNTKHIFGKMRHHSEKCTDPHPKHSTRPTGSHRRCHANNVAGTDC